MEAYIETSLQSGYTVENKSRSHTWVGDEPEDIGGEDLGPKPSEFILAGLADCKLITMRMYAERKGWDLQDASITLKIIGQEEKNDHRKINKC